MGRMQGRAGESRGEQGRARESKGEQGRAGESRGEQGRAGDKKRKPNDQKTEKGTTKSSEIQCYIIFFTKKNQQRTLVSSDRVSTLPSTSLGSRTALTVTKQPEASCNV